MSTGALSVVVFNNSRQIPARKPSTANLPCYAMPAPNPDQNEVEHLMVFTNGHLPQHPLHDHLWLRTFIQEKYQTCHLLKQH